MKEVTIYTDGACRGNGKKDTIGGIGIVFLYNGVTKEVKRAYRNTTNNIMELTAVIIALKTLKEPCRVTLYSDSAYVINAINQKWINNWQKNGWKSSNKSDVKNRELWEQIIELIKVHNVTFIKVKGHSDNEYNNICDKLANQAMDDLTTIQKESSNLL